MGLDFTQLQHVGIVRNLQSLCRILLDDDDRHTFFFNFKNDVHDVTNDQGG